MGRPLRFVPPDSVVEVTARATGSRLLLRPDPIVNEIIVGIVGRAQARYQVHIYGLVVLGNHLHALLGVATAVQLADFMRFVLGNIAREIGRHHGWHGRFWGRRYSSIVVADGEAQVSRLSYILSNGCKEDLVERPEDWPGVTSARALIEGERLAGTWFDRTAEYEARRRGRKPDPRLTTTVYEVALSKLPVWVHLDNQEYADAVRDLARSVEESCRRERQAGGGRTVLGADRVVAQDPHSAPAATKSSSAPRVHAATASARRTFLEAYRAFVDAFRTAATRLRAGERGDEDFPENAFPPPRPFTTPLCAAA
jgi:REP element-mobilizing transposase RayT